MDTTQETSPRRRRRKVADVETPLADRINAAVTQLGGHFAERHDALRCMVIALLTGLNYLLVGPRGTAKTAMAVALMRHVQGSRHFSTLLGSFSTLNDIVGRIDLAALQRGEERRKTEGRLLECDTAFIDEALKGSDGVLNSMLGLLSENRDFEGKRVDLWSVGSATNWPEVERRNERIAALYDRFHIKVPVNSVSTREGRVAVLRASRAEYQPDPSATWTMAEIHLAASDVSKVTIAPEVEELLCSIQERCVKEGIEVSDRKLGQWQKAIQASAWLDGRTDVGVEDFSVIAFMAWDDAGDIDKARGIVESCDLELVQGLVKRIDEAREAYVQARRGTFTVEKAGVILDQITSTAEFVSNVMKKYRLKPESKRDVARAVSALHKDFEAIYSQFAPQLEGEG